MSFKISCLKKSLVITLILGLFSATGLAQSHQVSIAPLGFINKVRGKYEYAFNKTFSIGAISDVYYPVIFKDFFGRNRVEINKYYGPKLSLFGRLYLFNRNSFRGFYLQPKMIAARFSSNMDMVYIKENNNNSLKKTKRSRVVSFFSFGAGANIGYQFKMGNFLYVDIQAGYQTMNYIDENYTEIIDGKEHFLKKKLKNGKNVSSEDFNPQKWERLGPGAKWHAMLTLGVEI